MEEELGDILFSLVNVARHNGISAEDALRRTTQKFTKRFNYIEEQLNYNSDKMRESSLDELDKLWEESKQVGL